MQRKLKSSTGAISEEPLNLSHEIKDLSDPGYAQDQRSFLLVVMFNCMCQLFGPWAAHRSSQIFF